MKSHVRTMMTASPSLLVTIATILLAFIAIIGSAFSTDPAGAYLITIGFATFAIVCGSFWLRNSFDVLEPMVLVGIAVFIGAAMRSVYIAFLPPSYDNVYTLIGNMSYIDLAVSESTVPFSMLIFVIGYLSWRRRIPIEKTRPFRTEVWPTARTMASVVVMACLGGASIIILIKAAGISLADLATLSQKRTIDMSVVGGDASTHGGLLRLFVSWLDVATLVLFTKWACRTDSKGRPKKFGVVRLAIIAVMVLACMVWPILSSSRTDTVQIVFSIMIIHVYLRNRGNLKRFIRLGFTVLGFALTVLVVMGLWRNLANHAKVSTDSPVQSFLDKTVGSGNFFPPERTGYIIAHFEDSQFLNGTSYLDWLAAPIPKTVWPDRPIIGLGEMVRGTIYKRPIENSGYPPGMLGEAYMNFSYFGLFVIPFIMGALMKFIYLTFKPLLGVNKNATVLYAAILWKVGLQLVGQDFSMVMVNLGTTIVPLTMFFFIMSKPRPVESTLPHPAIPALDMA